MDKRDGVLNVYPWRMRWMNLKITINNRRDAKLAAKYLHRYFMTSHKPSPLTKALQLGLRQYINPPPTRGQNSEVSVADRKHLQKIPYLKLLHTGNLPEDLVLCYALSWVYDGRR